MLAGAIRLVFYWSKARVALALPRVQVGLLGGLVRPALGEALQSVLAQIVIALALGSVFHLVEAGDARAHSSNVCLPPGALVHTASVVRAPVAGALAGVTLFILCGAADALAPTTDILLARAALFDAAVPVEAHVASAFAR